MLKLKTIQKHAALVATFLFIASFWGANVVQAQWEPVGPYQGGISNLNKFGDTLLTFCGKKRAYAAGMDNYLWKRVNRTLPEKSRALIRDKDNLYVLLDSSIANSTDKGVTWTKPSWMKKFEELKCSIASCYIKDSFLLISTSKGVFTSNNYGVDWTRNQFEGENVSGSDIFVSKNTDTLILGSLAKIFISYNRGLNWKKIIIDDKSSDQEVKVPFYYNGDIIISSHDEGFKHSEDEGETWQKSYKLPFFERFFLLDSNLIGLCNDKTNPSGLYILSRDSSSYKTERILLEGVEVKDFLKTNDNTLLAGTSKGLMISKDNGLTWETKKDGLQEVPISLLASNGNSLIAIGSYNRSFLNSLTSDLGKTWNSFPLDTNHLQARSIDIKDSFIVYTDFPYYTKGRLFFSTTSGDTWQYFTNEISDLTTYCAIITSNGWIIARTENGVFLSKDSCKTWELTDSSAISYSQTTLAETSNGILAGSDDGALRTTDNGLTWNKIDYAFKNPKIYGIHAKDSVVIAFNLDSTLYISTDCGDSWQLRTTPFPNMFNAEVIDRIIFCASNSGIFYSTDLGSVWKNAGDATINDYISGVKRIGDYIFIGSAESGVYRAKLSDFGIHVSVVEDIESETNNFLYIFPPFPLPAKLQLKALMYWDYKNDIEQADISVYNLFGKVAGREDIIIEKTAPYSGYLVWDCSRYEPGVYFIVVRHGDATQMIKAIVER
ncbi:MAG: hypothetical protein ACM3U1_03775 [Chloroflexota bacterium]